MNAKKVLNKLTAGGLFTAIVAIYSPDALGLLKCAEVFPPFSKISSTNRAHFDADFSAKDIRLIKHAIWRIDVLAQPLQKPAQTTVSANVENFLESKFSGLDDQIEFRLAEVRTNRVKSIAVFAHEYGHAYFEENFKFNINGERLGMADLFKRKQKIVAALQQEPAYQALQNRRTFLNEHGGRQEEIQQVLAQLNEMYADRCKSIDPQAEELMNRVKIMATPYNELFADLVASLYTRNGASVADAMNLSQTAPFLIRHEDGTVVSKYRSELSGNPPRPRDFTVSIPMKNFRPDSGRGFIYTMLDPVRSMLWQKFVVHTNEADYGKLLKAYLLAVEKHISQRISQGEARGSDNWNIVELNNEFLNLFTAEISLAIPNLNDREQP